MRIPSYQIYNVLQQYVDRLTENSRRSEPISSLKDSNDGLGLIGVRSRRKLVEAIIKTIMTHVHEQRHGDLQKEAAKTLPVAPLVCRPSIGGDSSLPFVYHTMDQWTGKVQRTISVARFF